jgi:predicted transposase/invertase (TIGR01784 family)
MKQKNRKPLLSPTNDYVFRGIFSNPKNADALKDMLQSVLDIPEEEYEHIEIDDPHLHREYEDGKSGILDLRVHTVSGRIIQVELQVRPTTSFKERIVRYPAEVYSRQVARGDDYSVIRPVVSIVITDFILFRESNKYHHKFCLYDIDDGCKLTDSFEIDTLELPVLPAKSDESDLWDWMEWMRTDKEETMAELAKKNPNIGKVTAVLRQMSEDETERRIAEAHERARMDKIGQLRYAREEGLEEGIEKGREAERIEVAKKLRDKGMGVAEIVEITGLPIQDVEKL